jgi:hypothetical protein
MRKASAISLKRLLAEKKPTMIIHIMDLECIVDANPYVYSDDETERLKDLVSSLAEDIWIDKTYVAFKGNRWKDAFIVEKKWYDLIRLLVRTNSEKNVGKLSKDVITESLLVLSMAYLYQMASKYGYDPEDIDISFAPKTKISVEYLEDSRTDWSC